MIKKLVCMVVAATMLLALISCSTEPSVNDSGKSYSFIYNEVKFAPGDDFAPINAKLGEPSGYYEAASCAFDGKDKIYTYGSVQISVSPLDGKDIIFLITLLDDSLSTPEGIFVGSEKAAVIQAYGAGEDNGSSLVYNAGKVNLVFLVRDGRVTSVQYRYVDTVTES